MVVGQIGRAPLRFVSADEHGPPFVVDVPVMPAAQEDGVHQTCCATLAPELDMVAICPAGGATAAWKCASAVSGDESFTDCWGDGAVLAADVEGYPLVVDEDLGDHRVAGDHLRGRR